MSSSEKRLAIHQPNFLPWIGYFHKMAHVDEFVLFDDVQFPRGKSYGNRVLIKVGEKESWITVPTKKKSELLLFSEIEIDYQQNWSRKMLKTVFLNYKKARHFDNVYPGLENIFELKYEKLFDLNFALIEFCMQKGGMKTDLIISSNIPSNSNIDGEEKIMNILRSRAASTYLSGAGAGSRRYLNEDHFKEEGIELIWQEMKKDYSYEQLGNNFIPNLSIIDILFNLGEETNEFLLSI